MAQLIGISTDSVETRKEFLKRARAVLEPFAGLASGGAEFKKTSLIWAAPSGAPLNLAEDGAASSFVLGRRNGTYWAAVGEDVCGDLTLETDVLGVFPIYYYSTPETCVFSTTPAAFKFCPGFRAKL